MTPTLAVIAKAPRPGFSKTRLCPHLSPAGAAELARAALSDTLQAVRSAAAGRRVLVLDGPPGACLLHGIEVIPQRCGGLDGRLAGAFEDLGGPTLIVGMDTPQLTPELLERGLTLLEHHDAVLGPAADGGYWAIGLRHPEPLALLGVPMSSPRTFAAQQARLRALGLRTAGLPALRDVDTFADALAVAEGVPESAFARRLTALVGAQRAA